MMEEKKLQVISTAVAVLFALFILSFGGMLANAIGVGFLTGYAAPSNDLKNMLIISCAIVSFLSLVIIIIKAVNFFKDNKLTLHETILEVICLLAIIAFIVALGVTKNKDNTMDSTFFLESLGSLISLFIILIVFITCNFIVMKRNPKESKIGSAISDVFKKYYLIIACSVLGIFIATTSVCIGLGLVPIKLQYDSHDVNDTYYNSYNNTTTIYGEVYFKNNSGEQIQKVIITFEVYSDLTDNYIKKVTTIRRNIKNGEQISIWYSAYPSGDHRTSNVEIIVHTKVTGTRKILIAGYCLLTGVVAGLYLVTDATIRTIKRKRKTELPI